MTQIVENGVAKDQVAEQTLDIVATQTVAVGAASVASLAVNNLTHRVVLVSTTDCWIALGVLPVAAVGGAGSFLLPANAPSYPIKIVPGVTQVAAIQNALAGSLSVIESA